MLHMPVFVMRMKQDEPVEDEVAEKTERDKERDGLGTVKSGAERNGFRQKVEERHARHRSRRESEDKVEVVAEPERERAAHERGGAGSETIEKHHAM